MQERNPCNVIVELPYSSDNIGISLFEIFDYFNSMREILAAANMVVY